MINKRAGRRPGGPDTKAEILTVARTLFADAGYDRTSLRQVAQAAGVDPSLIVHYFGSKGGLFTEVLASTVQSGRLEELAQGPLTTLGERLLGAYLAIWESPEAGATAQAMFRSAATNREAATLLRHVLETELLGPAAELLGGTHPHLRAQLAGSQLVGLAMARYVLRIQPLADLSAAEVVALAGPGVQRYLTGRLDFPSEG